MALRIKQKYRYADTDWWEWSVWLDGTDHELDRIEYVTYYLHDSFPKPVRTVDDRRTKFKLESAGWGTFMLHATVTFKDGTEKGLHHELVLEYPDRTATLR